MSSNTFGCVCAISQLTEMSPFPQSAISSIIPFMFDSNLLTAFSLFYPFSSLLVNSFLIIHFCKILQGLTSRRRHEGSTIIRFAVVFEPNNRCTVTNY